MTVRQASAQSDHSLRYALTGWLRTQTFFMQTAKTLIRLGGCPGWSESSLGSHLLCWFCHEAAQILILMCLFWKQKLAASVHFASKLYYRSRCFVSTRCYMYVQLINQSYQFDMTLGFHARDSYFTKHCCMILLNRLEVWIPYTNSNSQVIKCD